MVASGATKDELSDAVDTMIEEVRLISYRANIFKPVFDLRM